MKFLVDMNLSPGWVDFLVEAKHEATHCSNVGLAETSDAILMRWAAEHGYVVLTNDLGFGAILAATQRRKPSVVQIRSGTLTPKVIGSVVLTAIRQSFQELEEGALVSVDVGRSRLRVLPLGN